MHPTVEDIVGRALLEIIEPVLNRRPGDWLPHAVSDDGGSNRVPDN